MSKYCPDWQNTPCANAGCNKMRLEKSRYCSMECYKLSKREYGRATQKGNRAIAMAERHDRVRVSILPPTVATPYIVSNAEYVRWLGQYEPGTEIVIGDEKIIVPERLF
jgi:hypothetical protein